MHPPPFDEIPDVGFAAREHLIGGDITGTDDDAARPDVTLDPAGVLRSQLEVILENDGLPVEHEGNIIGFGVEDVENPVYELDQQERETRHREVPLPVPVSVRNEHYLELSLRSWLSFIIARRSSAWYTEIYEREDTDGSDLGRELSLDALSSHDMYPKASLEFLQGRQEP